MSTTRDLGWTTTKLIRPGISMQGTRTEMTDPQIVTVAAQDDGETWYNFIGGFLVCAHASEEAADLCAKTLDAVILARLGSLGVTLSAPAAMSEDSDG